MFKKFMFIGIAAVGLAGCATQRQTEGTAIGAVGGAVVGGPVGAVAGAAVGATVTAPGAPLARHHRPARRHHVHHTRRRHR
jgi:hypothetical protein